MLHIIVNPYSSSGLGIIKWERIRRLFDEAGAEYEVHIPSRNTTIESICEEITEKENGGEVRLCVLGGDGTMNAVVNGIVDFSRTKVGFIQLGSGNDLALGLGISDKKTEELVDNILRGETVRRCDVGEVLFYNRYDELDPLTHQPLASGQDRNDSAYEAGQDREGGADESGKGRREGSKRAIKCTRFNVSAGIGFDAAICQEANASNLKTVLNKLHIGKLVYIGVACKQIFTCPKVKMRIRLIDEAAEPKTAGQNCADTKMQGRESRNFIETEAAPAVKNGRKDLQGLKKESRGDTAVTTLGCRKALFAAFMNTRFEGGGFNFAPEADPGDGFLNLCAADSLARPAFFYIFPQAYNGSHLRFKGVLSGRSNAVDIRTDRPLWVHTDGEVTCRSSHICLRVKKGALQMLC